MTTRGRRTPTLPDWSAADAAAAGHRQRRLHPDPRERTVNRTLLRIAVALWIAAVVTAAVAFFTAGGAGFTVGIVGYGLLVAYGAVVLVWGTRTGRWLWRGSGASIRTALPVEAWPAVRRQLAHRQPVDREHREVVVELAHQQRRLLSGWLAFGGFYVPFYLGLAHSSHGALQAGTLLIGAGLIVVGAIAGINAHRRLRQVLHEASD